MEATAGSASAANGASGAVPPELVGKRGPGRPKGSTNKPKEPTREERDLSVKTLANAWQGLWLLSRLITFFVAGRRNSPVAKATGDTWALTDLSADEAEEDARLLLPLARELPAAAFRLLAWIGAPVLLAKRIGAHLVRKKPAPPKKDEKGEG